MVGKKSHLREDKGAGRKEDHRRASGGIVSQADRKADEKTGKEKNDEKADCARAQITRIRTEASDQVRKWEKWLHKGSGEGRKGEG